MICKSYEKNFNFYNNLINIETNDLNVLNQITYIYREYIDESGLKPIYYVKIENNGNNKYLLSELIDNNNIKITHGKSKKMMKKWTDKVTFLPPITVPFFQNQFSFFHGCAIRIKNKTVVILGPSRSGKTTLIMELMDLKCKLISDDLVVINNIDGSILPFKKPIGIRNTNKFLFEKRIQRLLIDKDNSPPFFSLANGLQTALIHITDVNDWSFFEKASYIDEIYFISDNFKDVDSTEDFFKLFLKQACISMDIVNTLMKIYLQLKKTPAKINVRDLNDVLKVLDI